MPSTNKTSFLSLNKWVASDSPKMNDFNSDNQLLDDAIKAHHENSALHLSAAQNAWLSQPTAVGSYTGNGDALRTISLGYTPALLIVFADGYAPLEGDPIGDFFVLRYAIAAGGHATPGISVQETAFQATQHQNDPPTGLYRVNLNESGVTYLYFAIK